MTLNYQQQSLQSASGVDLVLALYDGAIRFLYRAIQAVEEDDVVGRRTAVHRVTEILIHLQSSLRVDVGGKTAHTLADFYTTMFTMTLEASYAASKDQFLEVIRCLRNVRDAWQVVARDPEAQKVLPRDLRSQATNARPTTPQPSKRTTVTRLAPRKPSNLTLPTTTESTSTSWSA